MVNSRTPCARYQGPSVKPKPRHNGVRRPPPDALGITLRRLVIGLAKVGKGIAHCIARGVRNGHGCRLALRLRAGHLPRRPDDEAGHIRSEEHTSELQSLMRISYAVFCLQKKKT